MISLIILLIVPLACSLWTYRYTYREYIKLYDKDVSKIEKKISKMADNTDIILQSLGDLKNDLDGVRKEITGVSNRVNTLTTDVAVLKANINNKANDKALKNARIVAYITTGISSITAIAILVITIYTNKIHQQNIQNFKDKTEYNSSK